VTSLRDAAGRLAFVTNIESPVGGANRCGGALVSPSMDHPGQPGVSRAQVTASDSRCPRAPEGVASRVHAPLLPSPGNRGREPTRLPRLGQYLPFPGRTLERGLIELFRTGAWARGEKRKPRHGSVAEALVPSGARAVLRKNGPKDLP
jgi:hypothetical protein